MPCLIVHPYGKLSKLDTRWHRQRLLCHLCQGILYLVSVWHLYIGVTRWIQLMISKAMFVSLDALCIYNSFLQNFTLIHYLIIIVLFLEVNKKKLIEGAKFIWFEWLFNCYTFFFIKRVVRCNEVPVMRGLGKVYCMQPYSALQEVFRTRIHDL